ncbi:MAG TPA: hypothetical protein VLS93_04310 [Anaeromyxobacteraceae bacterium]|nr:hypothetical protein [Anaeromyxobacteraceae bacterium]
MQKTLLLAVALALAAAPAARAGTIEATSTTFLQAGQQSRGGTPGQEPELATVAPLFELLTVSARDVRLGFVKDLEIQISTWGSYELADPRWDVGTSGDGTGDVLTAFARARFLKRRLTVRLGREMVATGAARFLQIDGGDLSLKLPAGFGLSGYVGSPVSQRFQSRSGLQSWNPAGGDLAYGGRVSWGRFLDGVGGRGVDVGAFVAIVTDGGDTARQDVGADLRIQPFGNLTLSGNGVYSLEAERLAETTAVLLWTPVRHVHLTADVRFSAPDLMLPRTSILSVFADSERTEAGVGATLQVTRTLDVGLDARLLSEPGEQAGETNTGYEVRARGGFARGPTALGAEVSTLDSLDNGYVAARVYGRHEIGRLFGAADLIAHFLREQVNGEDVAVTGTLTGGYRIGGGWSAAVAGRAGMNPFFEQQFDAMVKLVYNQTYTVREVR